MKRAILALFLLLAVNAGANQGFGVGGVGPSGPTGATGASGGGGGTGTTNQVIKFTDGAGGVIGNSGVSDDGTTVSSAEHFSVTTKELQEQYTNNTSTGTTASKFVKWDGAGKVVVAAAATDAVKGICRTNCGTSGSAQVAISGSSVPCVFDNATTANDYVTVSSAGGCHDSGSTFPTGTPVVGTIPSTNGGAGTYNIDLNGADVASATIAGGGNGKIGGSGAANLLAYFTGGTTLASSSNLTWDAANFRLKGLNMTQSGSAYGVEFDVATATTGSLGLFFFVTPQGSSAATQSGVQTTLAAGYTGTSVTRAGYFNNATLGAGATLNAANNSGPSANMGDWSEAVASTAGYNVGSFGEGANSTVLNIGTWGWAAGSTVAGQHIGVLGSAGNSGATSKFANMALVGLLSNTLPTQGSTTNTALLLDGAGSNEIMAFNANTLNFVVSSTGAISQSAGIVTSGTITSSRTTDLGWSVVAGTNTACNTTCTSACVMGTDAVTGGFLACTDATADVCLCAGAS